MTLLIVYGLLALGVSFICSLLEASLLSIPRSQVESLVAQGSPTGRALQTMKENIDRPLAAILTLNTIAHTVGAAGVGAQAALVFGDALVGVVSGVMTLLILVLSEIIPKTLGAVHCRSLAGVTVWVTRLMIVVCFPIILALEQINRLIGYQRHRERIGRMEVLATIRLGSQAGALLDRESRIAMNVMSLSDVRVSEILTPRTVVFSLPEGMTAEEVVRRHHPLLFSRIPLYEESIERINGYVLRFEIHKAITEGAGEEPIAQLRHELIVLPEQASVADAMERLLTEGEHIALVVDEYGGTAGLVTLEDILESVVGQEITDETDPVPDMQSLAKHKARRYGVSHKKK
jgi:CBS domain containing-hemolysin-like protein